MMREATGKFSVAWDLPEAVSVQAVSAGILAWNRESKSPLMPRIARGGHFRGSWFRIYDPARPVTTLWADAPPGIGVRRRPFQPAIAHERCPTPRLWMRLARWGASTTTTAT